MPAVGVRGEEQVWFQQKDRVEEKDAEEEDKRTL